MNQDGGIFFYWDTELDCEQNSCSLSTHWITWDRAIVIATALTNHPGKRMRHATQEIIEFAGNYYNLAPNKMMLVEHYKTETLPQEDIYFHVRMLQNKTVRNELDKSTLIQLLGKTI